MNKAYVSRLLKENYITSKAPRKKDPRHWSVHVVDEMAKFYEELWALNVDPCDLVCFDETSVWLGSTPRKGYGAQGA